MYIGLRDLFRIGVGPSSSHTVGPMRAAARFVDGLARSGVLSRVGALSVDLYASLALTGRGHGTDAAILLGLEGAQPDRLDPDTVPQRLHVIRDRGVICLAGLHEVQFDEGKHLSFRGDESLPLHPNAVRFTASDSAGNLLESCVYYSVGGGFVRKAGEDDEALVSNACSVPYAFRSATELLEIAYEHKITLAELMRINEHASVPDEPVSQAIGKIWTAMQQCIARGLSASGDLPGVLKIRRRAPGIAARLREETSSDGLVALDWASTWAMAVNEENAAGGRVVTAPTNGAAGIVPAVARYYTEYGPEPTDRGLQDLFLVATAIGALCKMNGSISGAEVGCQGEVGVACAMAAGGLVAALGGNNAQIEQAAEMGIEHHLGMTCDPIAGLVQIPCIERNALAAAKAITAARLALKGDGSHRVSLDQAIATMWSTGTDMHVRYKETSLGGLAVAFVEC